MTVVINEMDVVAAEDGALGQAEGAGQQAGDTGAGRRPLRAEQEIERTIRVRTARTRRLRAY